MAPGGIGPALDELEDGDARFCFGLKLPSMEEFAFQGRNRSTRIVVQAALRLLMPFKPVALINPSTRANRRKHQSGSSSGWMRVQWQVTTSKHRS